MGLGTEKTDGLIEFGFPFSFYGTIELVNRGAINYIGALGNILFAIALGFAISFVVSIWQSKKPTR
jgi:hypothetical protein